MPCLLRVLTLIPRPLPFPSRADLSFIRFELGGNEELGFAYPRRSIDHGRCSSIMDGIADGVGIIIIPRLAPPFSFENYIPLARYSR